MTGPGVELDLGKIRDNSALLVSLLGRFEISLTGVTKAVRGLPEVAAAMLGAGAVAVADSRIENLERLRTSGISERLVLIRSPMMSQVDRVVRTADVSYNTEVSVLRALSAAARNAAVRHGVIVMVELGDLRDGVRPQDLRSIVDATFELPNLTLVGIGTNLACRSGVVPDEDNMATLSDLAEQVETSSGSPLEVVSGGNSANLDWLQREPDPGRVNDLRLGEAILFGREPLRRRPVPGLHTDALVVRAEVIESKRKPSAPKGHREETAFGASAPVVDRGEIWQTIVALGHQDTDPDGLEAPAGITILGASSDHLVLETPKQMAPGDSVRFLPGYGGFVRAMTSPYLGQTLTAPRSPS